MPVLLSKRGKRLYSGWTRHLRQNSNRRRKHTRGWGWKHGHVTQKKHGDAVWAWRGRVKGKACWSWIWAGDVEGQQEVLVRCRSTMYLLTAKGILGKTWAGDRGHKGCSSECLNSLDRWAGGLRSWVLRWANQCDCEAGLSSLWKFMETGGWFLRNREWKSLL